MKTTEPNIPPPPPGFTIYGQGPLPHPSFLSTRDIAAFCIYLEDDSWEIGYRGTSGDFYALRDGSEIARLNGMTGTTELETRWLEILETVTPAFRKLDAACEAAREAGALEIEGPLHKAIWGAFDRLLDLTDVDAWLSWFIWENDCGAKGLAVNGTPITSTADMARVLAAAGVQPPSPTHN